MTERLHKINESIGQKTSARDDYDKTIRETEAAYTKVSLFNKCLLQSRFWKVRKHCYLY